MGRRFLFTRIAGLWLFLIFLNGPAFSEDGSPDFNRKKNGGAADQTEEYGNRPPHDLQKECSFYRRTLEKSEPTFRELTIHAIRGFSHCSIKKGDFSILNRIIKWDSIPLLKEALRSFWRANQGDLSPKTEYDSAPFEELGTRVWYHNPELRREILFFFAEYSHLIPGDTLSSRCYEMSTNPDLSLQKPAIQCLARARTISPAKRGEILLSMVEQNAEKRLQIHGPVAPHFTEKRPDDGQNEIEKMAMILSQIPASALEDRTFRRRLMDLSDRTGRGLQQKAITQKILEINPDVESALWLLEQTKVSPELSTQIWKKVDDWLKGHKNLRATGLTRTRTRIYKGSTPGSEMVRVIRPGTYLFLSQLDDDLQTGMVRVHSDDTPSGYAPSRSLIVYRPR